MRKIFLQYWLRYGITLFLFYCCFPVYAVVEVGYQQDNNSQTATVASGNSTTTEVATGSSFIVDTSYALIINPTDAPDGSGIPLNSKAYRIMTYLFGTMDNSSYGGIMCLPPNPCSALMGRLFAVLNSGILTLGVLFLSYTIAHSAFSDAAQGTALGQKFSAQEVAFRSAVGLGFLLPTSTGYSVIQIAIVKLILLGSSAGTGLWQYLVLYYYAANEPIGSAHLYDNQSIKALGGETAAEDFVKDVGALETCLVYTNHNTQVTSPNWMVDDLYTDSTGVTYLRTGTPEADDGDFKNQCGCVNLGTLSNDEYTVVVNYIDQIRTLASTMTQNYFDNNQTINDITIYQNQYFIIKNLFRLELELLTLNEYNQQAAQNGNTADIYSSEWLDIPGYFFDLLSSPGGNLSVNFDSSIENDPSNQYISSTLNNYYNQATDWSDEADQSSHESIGISFNIRDFNKNAQGGSQVTQNLKEMFESVSEYQDPLVGLAAYGRHWLEVAMSVMIAAYVFSLLVAGVTGIAADYVGTFQMGIGVALIAIISSVLQAFGAIIPVASMFAIGLPMMPLIMFSSAIIAWIIYTIAAVMSGPIIAIGLISPGGGLGKAAPALMLLINLFMRPSLHVIGLVAGAKMFNIAYLYFTQAFITTVYEIFNIMSLPSDGTLMSLTSIIYMYAYTFAISAICSRCYSLITVIPDKAFTWVGAPPMGIPDQISQSARTAVQRSASQVEQKAAEMAKGLDEFMKQKVDEAMEKIQEREERGEARRNLRDDIEAGFWNAVDRVDNMRNNADNFFGGNQAMREASSALNSSRMDVFQAGITNPRAVIDSIRGEAPVGSAYRRALDARTAALGKYYTARLDYASSQEFAVRRELATSNEAVSKAVKQVENETRRLDNGRGNIESLTEARESLEKAQNMQQQSLLKVMDYMQANPARADVDPGHTIYRHAAQYHDTSFSLVKAAQDSLASAKSDMAKLMAEAKKHRIPAPAADVTKAQNAIDAAQTRLQTAIDNHKNLRDILKTNEAGLTNTVKMRLKLDVEVMIGEKTIGGVKTSVLLTPAEAKRIKDAELAKAFVAKEMSDAAVARAAGTLSDPQMVSRLALQDKLESFQKTGTALPQEQLYVKGARLLALGVGSSLAIAASPFIVIGSGLAGLATGERATTNSIINSSFQFLGDKLNINQNFKMTFGDLSAYGSSLSIRAQAATGYFSHQISASFAIDPAYNRAVAAQYAAVGAQARAHNQSIQPRLVEPYQGATRRELRDARKAVAVKRYEMSQAGKTERDILKDPDYQKLMQTVKDAENKLDRGNVFMQGLRSLDRGIKSGTKIMGETSRSTIREYLGYGQVIVSQDWGSATGIAKGVGAIMVAPFVAAIAITHVGADLAVRLPVALLVKVPGALMRPNRAKHMTYSDRQIFAFQQLSYKTDSYNSSGLLSYDHLSAAQSFRDIANVVTLGIVTLNSPMKKIAALSGGAGASSTAAASSITTTVSDGTISSASAPPPPTASGGAATSSTAAASSITIPVSDGTTSFASAPPLPTASGGAATSSTAAASSITIPVSDGTTSSASASPAIVSEPGPSILSDGAVSLDAAPPATASDGGLLSPYTAGLTTGTIHISTTAGVAGVNVGATLTPPIPNLDSGNVDMASAISTIPFGAEHNSFVASNGNLLIVPTEYPGLSESPSGVNPYLSQPGVIVIQS